MAPNEDLYRIGLEGFEAIDTYFGRSSIVPIAPLHRSLYYRNQVPLETVSPPCLVHQRTQVSQVCHHQLFPPPPSESTRGFQFGRIFHVKQQNPPKRMGEIRRGAPPLGPHRVQYQPVQEQDDHGTSGLVPAAEPASMNNFMAARLFGGVTRVDYGWFK
ncbi:hypothetical protein SAY87_023757 [Trapa incisa]|uniref:Uncharacterized protein n=2 Tax=Trapa TaxID=22665 RepID=A0AAN7KEM7_TRANT|nr:hypothetical protein SAY86_015388 [Trapa natans]KAK4775796.1 hypothetical protein SAY87_023757 [Trapa incisa]